MPSNRQCLSRCTCCSTRRFLPQYSPSVSYCTLCAIHCMANWHTSAFNACVGYFECIQLGHHFGRDLQPNLLALGCATVRLTSWRQAADDKLGHPETATAEIQTAKNMLFQIVALFIGTEKLSKKYRKDAGFG